MENTKLDSVLWQTAKRRTKFKQSLTSYIIVNTFLWAIYLTSHNNYSGSSFAWPIWVMFGWGIGLVMQYSEAYLKQKWYSTEDEYNKLKQQQKF
jgi:hypothetical protein